MEDQFVTEEIAKKLKELGFDKPCIIGLYIGNTTLNEDQYFECLPRQAENYNAKELCVSIPLWQQVIDWFRENYKIELWIIPVSYNTRYMAKGIIRHDVLEHELIINEWYDTYVEAREKSIIEALKHIKTK